MQYVFPELKSLYNILEVDFHPLKLYEKVRPCMDYVAANEDLAQYVPALEDIIVTRVLKQVTLQALIGQMKLPNLYAIILSMWCSNSYKIN